MLIWQAQSEKLSSEGQNIPGGWGSWCVAFGEYKFNKKAVMNFSFGKSGCRT